MKRRPLRLRRVSGQTIKRSAQVYNQHLSQKALCHIAPIQVLKDWRDKRPELDKKRIYTHAIIILRFS